MKTPLSFSFVIPAYNEEALIGKCIRSILREIERTNTRAEIIVVDNGSTDRTSEIAASYPHVTVITETLQGVTHARNAGYKTATGQLIANIDADIVLPPGWIDVVRDTFEKKPEHVALGGPYVFYDLPFLSQALLRIFDGFGFIYYLFNTYVWRVGPMVCGGNFVVRRGALEETGGCDPTIGQLGEDTEIAKRLDSLGKVGWSYKLFVYASGRRYAKLGVVRLTFMYLWNYFEVLMTGKPTNVEYTPVRSER